MVIDSSEYELGYCWRTTASLYWNISPKTLQTDHILQEIIIFIFIARVSHAGTAGRRVISTLS